MLPDHHPPLWGQAARGQAVNLPNLNAEHCPGCGRMRDTSHGKFVRHADASMLRECSWSQQPIPSSRAHQMARAARTVLNLADQLRVDDPDLVLRYLQRLTPDKLQEFAMVALAAVNPDQTVDDAFGWVMELPAARLAS